MANELRDKGIEIANQAVQADNGEEPTPPPDVCNTPACARAQSGV